MHRNGTLSIFAQQCYCYYKHKCLLGRDLGSLLVLTVDAAGTAVPGPEQEVPRPRGRLLRPRLLLPPVLLLHGLAQGKEAVLSLKERSAKRAFLMKYEARKCGVLFLILRNYMGKAGTTIFYR